MNSVLASRMWATRLAYFFRRQEMKENWPYLFVQSGNKITEQDSECMHSDSSDSRTYFVILVRQIEHKVGYLSASSSLLLVL